MPSTPSRLRLAACWAVHFYTASGAVLALAALAATVRQQIPAAFACLYLAVVVDATDGTLARVAGVKRYIPHFDGAKLDDIVDYLTFVVVPLFLMLQVGLLDGWPGAAAAAGATLASAYRFCHADAKTPEHFFTGFPSYWNVLALYLYVLRPQPWVCATITAVLAVLVFAPLRFIYPSRTPWLRRSSVGLGLLWAVLVAAILARLPERPETLAVVSLLYPLYYTLASFWLDWRTRGITGLGPAVERAERKREEEPR